MDQTKETIDRLIELGAVVTPVYEDALNRVVALNGKTTTINKSVPRRNHTLKTLPGLVAYVTGQRSGDRNGLIFVGGNNIVADLAYLSTIPEKVTLPMDLSEEFIALKSLFNGVDQKALWRALLTKLSGCLDDELLMQVSNLNVKASKDTALSIARIGTENAAKATALRVTWTDPAGKGSTTRDLQDKWVWRGRIWEAYEKLFEIELTLEIDTDNGLLFRFHPRRLEEKLRFARLDLVDALRQQIPGERFEIHEGEF